MEKSLFTAENAMKAIEKLFLAERFIKWTGDNLLNVYSFSSDEPGGYLKYFSTWDEYKTYVAEHNNIYKLFTQTGHYEIPVDSWLVKTPDGEVFPAGPGVRFITEDFTKKFHDAISEFEIPIIKDREEEKPITTYYPEDIYENEVVCEGNSISLRRKLDENGKPILKKCKKEWKSGLEKFMK